MKLTLLHKGLFLVCIPLCFEVTIFGWLLNLQAQMEVDAQRISRNKKINDEVNRMVRDIVAMTDLTENMDSSFTGVFGRIAKAQGKMRDVVASMETLKRLVKGDHLLERRVVDISDGLMMARQDANNMVDTLRHTSPENMNLVINSARRKIDVDIHRSFQSGLLYLAEESSKGTSDDISRQIREETRLLLKCALAASVLIALTFALIYSKQLAGRLARLNANADRLAHGQELLPPLGGTDEVAELDRTFHSAAVLIEGAKRMRQEVTAMISHDLKSPLQSIRSYLEMLETGILGELNEKGERLLVNSQRASDHMSNLIDSVLQLEKLRSGSIRLKQEKVVLSSLLTTCLDLVRASADGKAVRLETSFEHDDSDCVIGDEFWLKEVFVNILSNAVKFTPEKSKVTVSTRQVGDRMEVAVADEGPGIRDSEKKVIFERFSRLKSAAAVAGTGLGLPIAKELVEMHHGSIEVDSHVGLGSTFVILLPVSKPSTDA